MNLKLLVPAINWLPRLKHFGVTGDISAGVTGALLAFPQAVALAALAGMPPVYGIYASILPLMIAALWGSSWHAIGGVNTAMAMLLFAAVSSMADPFSNEYIAIVLVLTIITGLFQLLIGLFGLGRILDFISSTVITTLTLAVSLSIMVAVLPGMLGSDYNLTGTVLRRFLELPEVFTTMHYPIVILSLFTLLCGFIAQSFLPKFSFILAMIAGTVLYWVMKLFLPDFFSSAQMLESVSFNLLSFAVPDFSLIQLDENNILHLIVSALSLALLGMTQAVVIARSMSLSSGQRIDVNKEITGQGMSNIVAGFFSAFAVSSSFSSSATNKASGANSPFAAIVIAILVVLIGLLASDFLSLVPVAVISGGLMLIGLTMFKPKILLSFLYPRHEFLIFMVTLISLLSFGLIAGVVSGVVLSAMVYLWKTANPTIQVEEQTASNGHPIHIVNIDGSLFFGAVQRVESVLRQWTQRDGEPSTLLLRTDNISYLDVPGVRLLVEEAERRLKEGGDFYLYVDRDSIYNQLLNSRLLPLIGNEHVIRQNIDHPMNAILFPYQASSQDLPETNLLGSHLSTLSFPLLASKDEEVQKQLMTSLQQLKVFSRLSEEELNSLVCSSTVFFAREDELVASHENDLKEFLVLLEGQLLLEKEGSSQSHQYNRKIFPGMQQSLISPNIAKNNSLLTALQDSYYILLAPESVDSMVSRLTLTSGEKLSSVLELIEPEFAEDIKQKLKTRKVKKNQTLVHQGDAANEFYIIYEGEADVIRHNLLDGNHHFIARLRGGDSFGEEALLQGISRNADVTMSTDGEVGVLSKQDFDKYLRPLMAPAITSQDAIKLVESGVAKWLDCRFEPEYINGTLTEAILMPLTKVRQKAHELEDDVTYIAYCNNGRRSQAVTFLLRERSKNVLYLEGGLKSSDLHLQLGADVN